MKDPTKEEILEIAEEMRERGKSHIAASKSPDGRWEHGIQKPGSVMASCLYGALKF